METNFPNLRLTPETIQPEKPKQLELFHWQEFYPEHLETYQPKAPRFDIRAWWCNH